MEVKFMRLVPEATLPKKAYKTDVGFDVKCTSVEYVVDKDMYIYHTGLACETQMSQDDTVHKALVHPRSSNCNTEAYLCNAVGLVDTDGYRGEIQARFKNRTSLKVMIEIETMKRLLLESGLISIDELSYNRMLKTVTDEYVARAKNLEFAPYKTGDRCFQLVFGTEEPITITEVSGLTQSERGCGGHGSTNNKNL